MVELEKYPILKAENPLNLGGQQFYKISEVLQITHVVLRDTEDNIFYLNNYIDWDQFNQLYNPEWQTMRTQSSNAIVQKLMPASKKAIEQRQEAEARTTQIKISKKMDSGSLDQYEYDNHDTDESQ